MRTGTGPIHFQKVQHYAFMSPEFFLTSLHSTRRFPGLQRVLLGIERGGLLGRGQERGQGREFPFQCCLLQEERRER